MDGDETLYVADAGGWRAWLEEHHATARAVVLGLYRKGTGVPSITWPQAVDEALCFGWIDGVRRGVDAARYTIRFTPRRPASIWSKVNVARAEDLLARGLMQPAGLRAFEGRDGARSGVYSFEQGSEVALPPAYDAQLRAHAAAWDFFQKQAPSYRRAAIWWVIGARQELTRLRRLATLIDDAAQGRTIAHLTRRSAPRAGTGAGEGP